MFSFTPSLDSEITAANLRKILSPPIHPLLFGNDIRRLQCMFSAYIAACPPPWFAPGLVVSPETHYQSELWLPLSLIRPVYERFYYAALTYPPILSSSPLSSAASWAAVISALPSFFDCSADPSVLLEQLLSDDELRIKFLCWSFMPRRFYGNGSNRYPGQTEYIRKWLAQRQRKGEQLRCLDTACGDGAVTYELTRLIRKQGWQAEGFAVEGWSLEPLEVWSAAHARFPHDPARQLEFRTLLTPLFSRGAQQSMVFRAIDVEDFHSDPASATEGAGFDLIICNGLLGGPIINLPRRIETIVRNLSALLRPDGLLLAADHFHGGWKKNVSEEALGEIFRSCGLKVSEAGEGLGGFKGLENPLAEQRGLS
jgi:SAM-dependent methyltransferase